MKIYRIKNKSSKENLYPLWLILIFLTESKKGLEQKEKINNNIVLTEGQDLYVANSQRLRLESQRSVFSTERSKYDETSRSNK